jgi:hypothetical protein
MNLSGGRGVPEALMAASEIGDGWAFWRIRDALANARITGQTPWQALGVLGEEVQVSELKDLSAALSLVAEDGAKVRESLTARAVSLRRRELADLEGTSGGEVAVDAAGADASGRGVPGLPDVSGCPSPAAGMTKRSPMNTFKQPVEGARYLRTFLDVHMARLRTALGDKDRGASAVELAVITAVLVGLAVAILVIVVNFANKQGTTITNTTVPNPAQGGGGGG